MCVRLFYEGEGYHYYMTNNNNVFYQYRILLYLLYDHDKKIIVNYCQRIRQLDMVGDGEGLRTEQIKTSKTYNYIII